MRYTNQRLLYLLTLLAQGWQTIHEMGVVRSCEPFKFWWAPWQPYLWKG